MYKDASYVMHENLHTFNCRDMYGVALVFIFAAVGLYLGRRWSERAAE